MLERPLVCTAFRVSQLAKLTTSLHQSPHGDWWLGMLFVLRVIRVTRLSTAREFITESIFKVRYTGTVTNGTTMSLKVIKQGSPSAGAWDSATHPGIRNVWTDGICEPYLTKQPDEAPMGLSSVEYRGWTKRRRSLSSLSSWMG